MNQEGYAEEMLKTKRRTAVRYKPLVFLSSPQISAPGCSPMLDFRSCMKLRDVLKLTRYQGKELIRVVSLFRAFCCSHVLL